MRRPLLLLRRGYRTGTAYRGAVGKEAILG